MAVRELFVAFALLLAACSGGRNQGAPGSIGVIARREASSGRIVVVEVPPGSAGARSGLEVGDEIISIDGFAVADMTKEDFHRAVRGPVGTPVVVVVKRDGLLRKLVVEREAMRELP